MRRGCLPAGRSAPLQPTRAMARPAVQVRFAPNPALSPSAGHAGTGSGSRRAACSHPRRRRHAARTPPAALDAALPQGLAGLPGKYRSGLTVSPGPPGAAWPTRPGLPARPGPARRPRGDAGETRRAWPWPGSAQCDAGRREKLADPGAAMPRSRDAAKPTRTQLAIINPGRDAHLGCVRGG